MNATKNFTAQSIADLSPPQDLQSVLDTGNTATQDINLTGGINVTGNLSVTGHFIDSDCDLGTSGQLLMATATGTNWSTPIVPNLQNVLDLGNTATQDINLTGGITTDRLTVNNSLTNSGEYYDATSSVGTAGQILSSTGSATQWIDDVTPNLQNVLDAGHIATQDITLTGQIQVTGDTFATNSTVVDLITTKDIYIQEKIYDSGFSGGTIGQILSSTGTGTEWVSISGANPTLQTVLDAGNTATEDITLTGEINATGRIVSGTVVQGSEVLGTSSIDAPVQLSVGGYLRDSSGNVGTAGQVLSSTVTGVDWVSLPAPTAYPLQDVLNTGNSATSNMTITGTVSATSLTGDTVTAATTLTSSGNLYVNGRLHDAGNSPGAAGQVLASTGSAVDWITLPSTPTLQDVLDSGNNAVQDIVLNGGVDATTVSAIDITSSGQLTSNGTASINGTLEDPRAPPAPARSRPPRASATRRWAATAPTQTAPARAAQRARPAPRPPTPPGAPPAAPPAPTARRGTATDSRPSRAARRSPRSTAGTPSSAHSAAPARRPHATPRAVPRRWRAPRESRGPRSRPAPAARTRSSAGRSRPRAAGRAPCTAAAAPHRRAGVRVRVRQPRATSSPVIARHCPDAMISAHHALPLVRRNTTLPFRTSSVTSSSGRVASRVAHKPPRRACSLTSATVGIAPHVTRPRAASRSISASSAPRRASRCATSAAISSRETCPGASTSAMPTPSRIAAITTAPRGSLCITGASYDLTRAHHAAEPRTCPASTSCTAPASSITRHVSLIASSLLSPLPRHRPPQPQEAAQRASPVPPPVPSPPRPLPGLLLASRSHYSLTSLRP